MSKTYTPQEGSLPHRVISFFSANPGEELDLDALEAKFDKDRKQWHSILGPAIQAGLLKRTERREDGELVYSLGKNTAPASSSPPPDTSDALVRGGWLGAPAGAATKGKRTSPAKVELFDYSTLDLSKIEIRSAVPLPPVRGAGKFCWDPLLDLMMVDESVELPRKTRATIQAEIKRRKNAGLGEFSIRMLSGEKLGLWRVK